MAGLRISQYPPSYSEQEVVKTVNDLQQQARIAPPATAPRAGLPKAPVPVADAMFGPAPPESPYNAGPSLPGAGIARRVVANTVEPAIEAVKQGLPSWNDIVDGSRKFAVGAINTLAKPGDYIESKITGQPMRPDITVDQYRKALTGYQGVPPAPSEPELNATRGLAARATSDRINAAREGVIDSGLVVRSEVAAPTPRYQGAGLEMGVPVEPRAAMVPGEPVPFSTVEPALSRGVPAYAGGMPGASAADLPDMPAVSYRSQAVKYTDPDTGDVSYRTVSVPVDNTEEALRFAAQKAGLGLQERQLQYNMTRNAERDSFDRLKDTTDMTLRARGDARAEADQKAQNFQRTTEQLARALAERDRIGSGRYSQTDKDGQPEMGYYMRQAQDVLSQNGYALRAGGMSEFFDTGSLSPDQLGVLGQAVIPSRTEPKHLGLSMLGTRVVPPVLRLPAVQNPDAVYINDVPVSVQAAAQLGMTIDDLAQLPPDEFAALAPRVAAAGLPGRRVAKSAMR
jgi:hypothetical protein